MKLLNKEEFDLMKTWCLDQFDEGSIERILATLQRVAEENAQNVGRLQHTMRVLCVLLKRQGGDVFIQGKELKALADGTGIDGEQRGEDLHLKLRLPKPPLIIRPDFVAPKYEAIARKD